MITAEFDDALTTSFPQQYTTTLLQGTFTMPVCASGSSCTAPGMEVPRSSADSENFQHPCHICRAGCHGFGVGCCLEFDEVKDQLNLSTEKKDVAACSAVLCKACFHKLVKPPWILKFYAV